MKPVVKTEDFTFEIQVREKLESLKYLIQYHKTSIEALTRHMDAIDEPHRASIYKFLITQKKFLIDYMTKQVDHFNHKLTSQLN